MEARTIRSEEGCKEKNKELSAQELNTVELFPEKRAMTEEYDRAVHEQKMDGNSSDKPCRQALTGYFHAPVAAEGFDRMTCPAPTAVSLKMLQTSGSIFLP